MKVSIYGGPASAKKPQCHQGHLFSSIMFFCVSAKTLTISWGVRMSGMTAAFWGRISLLCTAYLHETLHFGANSEPCATMTEATCARWHRTCGIKDLRGH